MNGTISEWYNRWYYKIIKKKATNCTKSVKLYF